MHQQQMNTTSLPPMCIRGPVDETTGLSPCLPHEGTVRNFMIEQRVQKCYPVECRGNLPRDLDFLDISVEVCTGWRDIHERSMYSGIGGGVAHDNREAIAACPMTRSMTIHTMIDSEGSAVIQCDFVPARLIRTVAKYHPNCRSVTIANDIHRCPACAQRANVFIKPCCSEERHISNVERVLQQIIAVDVSTPECLDYATPIVPRTAVSEGFFIMSFSAVSFTSTHGHTATSLDGPNVQQDRPIRIKMPFTNPYGGYYAQIQVLNSGLSEAPLNGPYKYPGKSSLSN